MKLLLLFYQIRYSRENNRHSFVFQKCKTTNGKSGTAGEWRKFKLCKNQSFETNRFTRSKQSGSFSRQKNCMRWILIHLNSEFHAMLSWTLLDMLVRLNDENKSNWPNYLLPIAWTLIWNLQLRVTAITSLFSYFFLRVQKGLLSRVNSVEAVSSMSIKLLLLFYQIRYSRENKRHCFGF